MKFQHLAVHPAVSLAVAVMVVSLPTTMTGQTKTTARQPAKPDDALTLLKAGNRRFAAGKSVGKAIGEGVRRSLQLGQRPYAIVVTTADSRTAPEHIFNTGLGELYVLRTAGHKLNRSTLAGIEYAAELLGCKLCVVLGHDREDTLAMTAAGKNPAQSQAMARLQESLLPAMRRAKQQGLEGHDLVRAIARENVYETIVQTFKRSPMLRQSASKESFRMIPAFYDAGTGKVEWMPERPSSKAAWKKPKPFPKPERRATPPHVALRMLQAGHQRFLSPADPTGNVSPEERSKLVKTPRAYAVVVTASDSRVIPEHIFDAGLGELYVLRLPGTLYSDFAQASIEHAVARTGASLCVILGQENCGIARLASRQKGKDPKFSANLQRLIAAMAPAVQAARHKGSDKNDVVRLAVRQNALGFVETLRGRSSYLRAQEKRGAFAILAASYDPATGEIEWLKDRTPAHADTTKHGATRPHAGHGEEEDSHSLHGHDPSSDPAGHGEPEPAPSGEHHSEAGHGKAGQGKAGQGHDLPIIEDAHPTPLGETKGHGHDAHGHDTGEGHHAENEHAADDGGPRPSPSEAGTEAAYTLMAAGLFTLLCMLTLALWQSKKRRPKRARA